MQTVKNHYRQWLLLALIIVVTWLIYWPGLFGNYLLLDDIGNLAVIADLQGIDSVEKALIFIFGNNSGPLGRPLSMASFLLNSLEYPPQNPGLFRVTNLIIHCLTGVVLFLLSARLFRYFCPDQGHGQQPAIALWAALFVSAYWLFLPLNVSTTLYIVQRMAQLATLFSVLGVLLYCYGRERIAEPGWAGKLLIVSGIGLCTALAVLSKENGILVLVLVLAVEKTAFADSPRPRWFALLFRVTVQLPLLLLLAYLLYMAGNFAETYAQREFTLSERLLTQSRVLLSYLYQILVPTGRGTGIIHDDYVLSTGLLAPLSTLFSLLVNLGVLAAAFMLCRTKRYRPFSLAVFWYYGAHVLESTVIPLEMYFEHRNYLPMMGPIWLLGYLLYRCLSATSEHNPWPKFRIVIVPVLLMLTAWGALLTFQSSAIWASVGSLYKSWVIEKPDSLRAAELYGRYLIKNGNVDEGKLLLQQTYRQHPEAIHLPLIWMIADCQRGLNSDVTLAELTARIPQSRSSISTPTIIENLIAVSKNRSCPQFNEIHGFLDGIIALPGIRKGLQVIVYIEHAILYEAEGDLGTALGLLDEALAIKPLPAIAARQAVLLYKLGLREAALEKISQAETLLQQSTLYKQQERETLATLREQIQREQINRE